jgi:hypothetical protein
MVEGCRDAMERTAGVAQLPQNAILYSETASGLRYPDSAVTRGESVARNGVEESLALSAVGCLRGQPGGHADDFVPLVLE